MKWFGDLIRLAENTRTETALEYLNKETERPRG